MTHRERAGCVVSAMKNMEIFTAALGADAEEFIWRAMVAPRIEELERRREEEQAKLLAMRIQAALEDRNARLEGWLEMVDAMLGAEGDVSPGNLAAARAWLAEFRCEDGTI